MREAEIGDRYMPAAHQIVEHASVNDVAENHLILSTIKISRKPFKTVMALSQIKGSLSILVLLLRIAFAYAPFGIERNLRKPIRCDFHLCSAPLGVMFFSPVFWH